MTYNKWFNNNHDLTVLDKIEFGRKVWNAALTHGHIGKDVIKRLINIRDALTDARNINCICSGAIVCQCGKQSKIDACEKALWDEIEAL